MNDTALIGYVDCMGFAKIYQLFMNQMEQLFSLHFFQFFYTTKFKLSILLHHFQMH